MFLCRYLFFRRCFYEYKVGVRWVVWGLNKSTKNTTFFNLFHFGIFGVPIYNPNKKTFFQVVILYFGAYGIYSISRTSSQQKERFGKVPQQAAGVYRVRREVGRMGCYVGRVRENHESGVLANYGRMRSTGVQNAEGVVGPTVCDTSPASVTNRPKGRRAAYVALSRSLGSVGQGPTYYSTIKM